MQLVGRLYSLFYATPPLVLDRSIYIRIASLDITLYFFHEVCCLLSHCTEDYTLCLLYVYSTVCPFVSESSTQVRWRPPFHFGFLLGRRGLIERLLPSLTDLMGNSIFSWTFRRRRETLIAERTSFCTIELSGGRPPFLSLSIEFLLLYFSNTVTLAVAASSRKEEQEGVYFSVYRAFRPYPRYCALIPSSPNVIRFFFQPSDSFRKEYGPSMDVMDFFKSAYTTIHSYTT